MNFPLVYKGSGFEGDLRHPRTGQLCRIIAGGRGPGPHNVGLLFPDGHILVTRRADKSTRRAWTRDRQLTLF